MKRSKRLRWWMEFFPRLFAVIPVAYIRGEMCIYHSRKYVCPWCCCRSLAREESCPTSGSASLQTVSSCCRKLSRGSFSIQVSWSLENSKMTILRIKKISSNNLSKEKLSPVSPSLSLMQWEKS